ncbi:hypothetical protein [Metabacillus indicus]|uniref:hypothetical protein n=1 Tax=Metabacillus indicus TaxID=246786 RepID=UPI000493A40A|nr:hypothetical protein [Metabacillus indicus]KEZ50914.1 hypothetical protein AZ46_0209815 [Metabacillus indicus LMG 22858]
MKKELIYFLILFLLISTTKVFFDYQETKVLLWKQNVIEAFALAGIITFLNWLISPRNKQRKKPTKQENE